MAKRSGGTRTVSSSSAASARSASGMTRGDIYNEISVLESNPFSGQTLEYSNGNKSVTISYNGRQSWYSVRLMENGRQIREKGYRTSADAMTVAGIIRKHLK